MLIGKLAELSHFSRHTIRYYEKLSLISADARYSGNSYKDYSEETLQRLISIRHLKSVGFSLREIRKLLSPLATANPCAGLPDQLTGKIADIDERIGTLKRHRSELSRIKASCDEQCNQQQGLPSCLTVERSCCAS